LYSHLLSKGNRNLSATVTTITVATYKHLMSLIHLNNPIFTVAFTPKQVIILI